MNRNLLPVKASTVITPDPGVLPRVEFCSTPLGKRLIGAAGIVLAMAPVTVGAVILLGF